MSNVKHLVPASVAEQMDEWKRASKPWTPHDYQGRVMEFMLRKGYGGILLPPGMGKTSTTLAVGKILLQKKIIKRLLVSAPLRPCYEVWPAEMCEWSDFHDYGLALLHGNKEKVLRSLQPEHNLCVINPEGMPWLCQPKNMELLGDKCMLVVDECFAAGTTVRTDHGYTSIENIEVGDTVVNEFGSDIVTGIKCSMPVGNTVEVVLSNEKKIRCTEDHPFFTDFGWLPAKYLEGRRLFSLDELRNMRNSLQEDGGCVGGWYWENLLEILWSETCLEERYIGRGLEKKKDEGAWSSRYVGTHTLEQERTLQQRNSAEAIKCAQDQWAQMEDAWRQWNWSFRSRNSGSKVPAKEIYLQLSSRIGRQAAELSYQLQSRLWKSYGSSSVRSGRSQSSQSSAKNMGQEKRKQTSGTWVARVSHLEPGSVRFVYNLEVKKCPHFEIEDCALVHNSSLWKNSNSVRFRALRKHLHKFNRRYILTGSPRPNHYIDLFGQIYLLDQGDTLGTYVSHYRTQYFFPTGFQMREWEILPGADKKIEKAVAPMVIRLEARDYLTLPKEMEQLHRVVMPAEAREQYDSIENSLMSTLFSQPLVNSASARSKCCQIANGAVYTDSIAEERWNRRRPYKVLHTAKVDAVVDLVNELQGEPLLLGVGYKHDVEGLRAALGKDTPCINGDTTRGQATDYITRWNKGLIPVLLGHPASMGHGLNLQKFNAQHVGYFDIPDNYDTFDQFFQRVCRQGNKAAFVMRHFFVTANTVDVPKLRNLRRKDTGQKAFLQSMKKYTEQRARRRGVLYE